MNEHDALVALLALAGLLALPPAMRLARTSIDYVEHAGCQHEREAEFLANYVPTGDHWL